MQRLRRLDETECYLRCPASRSSAGSVKVLRLDDTPREPASVKAERIRVALESMLDAREPEAA